jgi:hypothetical protein
VVKNDIVKLFDSIKSYGMLSEVPRSLGYISSRVSDNSEKNRCSLLLFLIFYHLLLQEYRCPFATLYKLNSIFVIYSFTYVAKLLNAWHARLQIYLAILLISI